MKTRKSKISFFILIVMLSLMTFGTAWENTGIINSHEKSTEIGCMGAPCGPVEHMVLHACIVPDSESAGIGIEPCFDGDLRFYLNLHETFLPTKSPPPKLSYN